MELRGVAREFCTERVKQIDIHDDGFDYIAIPYTPCTGNNRKKHWKILIKYMFGKSVIVLGANKKKKKWVDPRHNHS